MKIFITGGCGYIGTSFIQSLNEKYPDAELIIYDNLSHKKFAFFINAKFSNVKARFIHGDLLDTKNLIQHLKDVNVVVHLAGLVTTPYADHTPHLFEQNNHWGTSSLITAIEMSPSVKRVIFLSTATVYGSGENEFSESDTANPETFYCISKYEAERQFMRLEDREIFILRSGNVYGHNVSMRMDAFINKFMFEAHFHKKIKVIGDGKQYRPVIHVDKLGEVINVLIEGDLIPGTFNVAEHNFNINEVVDHVKAIYPEIDVIYSSQQMPMRSLKLVLPCDILSLASDTTDFSKELHEIEQSFCF